MLDTINLAGFNAAYGTSIAVTVVPAGNGDGVTTVGNIPPGLPKLSFPSVGLDDLAVLFPAAMALFAVVALAETDLSEPIVNVCSGHGRALQERLGEVHVVVQIGEGDFGLDHPELGEVPRRVRVLRPERRPEGVDLGQCHAFLLGTYSTSAFTTQPVDPATIRSPRPSK